METNEIDAESERARCENQDLVLVKDKTLVESALGWILKSIFYPAGYISMLPNLIKSTRFYHQTDIPLRGKIVSATENEVILRRTDHSKKLLIEDGNLKTIHELFRASVVKFGDKDFMGTRKVIRERDYFDENLRRTLKKQLRGDYEWISYRAAGTLVDGLMSGMHHLNLPAKSKVAIFADTCKEWLLSMYAILNLGYLVVTVYSMLSDESISYCLSCTNVEVVFSDAKCLARLIKNISKMPSLTTVILLGNDDKESREDTLQVDGRIIKILYFWDLAVTEERLDSSFIPECTADDVAIIMFTSGSSGAPKGVNLLHKNAVTMIFGVTYDPKIWTQNEIYAAYLPLGHVMELISEILMTYLGSKIGYTSPLSLTDQSPMIDETGTGDLTVLKPSLIIFVPLLLERMQSGILEQIKKRGRLAQTVFEFAFNYKRHFRKFGYTQSILDLFIFKKTKAVGGSNLKGALVGGASVSIKTQEFLSICLCTNMIQGYGLTETCGCGAICEFDELSYGHVGAPMASCEIKLVAWEEGGYHPNDQPNPRGEILIHGSSVAAGYYNDPKQTDEAFITNPTTGEMWFHTGDIGEILHNGCLKIVDRKKDIVKLKHGEYVPLVKLENIFISSKYCGRCCACPNRDSEYLVLIVSVEYTPIKKLASSLHPDRPEMTLAEMIADPAIIQAVEEDMRVLQKNAKLGKFEIPQRITLVEDAWTPDTDLVTPTFKLKRRQIYNRYEALLH